MQKVKGQATISVTFTFPFEMETFGITGLNAIGNEAREFAFNMLKRALSPTPVIDLDGKVTGLKIEL